MSELNVNSKPSTPQPPTEISNKIIATQVGRQWEIKIFGVLGIRDVKALNRSLHVAVNRQRRNNAVSRYTGRSLRGAKESTDAR